MLGSDEEYCLTLDQKSISVLIRLRGRFLTPEDVMSVKPELDYEEAMKIASKCNEKLLEVQRFLFSQI